MPLQQLPQLQYPDSNALAKTMLAAQEIQGRRRQNQLADLEMRRDAELRNSLPGALEGDAEAQARVMHANPQVGMQLQKQNEQQKLLRGQEIAGHLAFIMGKKDPAVKQQYWDSLRATMSAKMPEYKQIFDSHPQWDDALAVQVVSRYMPPEEMAKLAEVEKERYTPQTIQVGDEAIYGAYDSQGNFKPTVVDGQVARGAKFAPRTAGGQRPIAGTYNGQPAMGTLDENGQFKPIPGLAPPPGTKMFEDTQSRKFGEELVKEYSDIRERSTVASDLISNYEMAENLDVETGALEPTKAKMGALLQGLGLDPNTLGLPSADKPEALYGIMNNVVLQKMIAQKGPQTENDAKRIQQTVASLGNTPEAFKFLMKSGKAIERMKIDQHNFWLNYRDANNGSLEGASRAWNEFKAKTPLVIKNPKTGMPVTFYEFKDAYTSAVPNATTEDVLKEWRNAANVK